MSTGPSDTELAQIMAEIDSADGSGDITRSAFLQSLYVDRVYEKRQRAAEELLGACLEYIGRPEVRREHPSLMDACDDDPVTAAKYAIWLMTAMAADGIQRDIKFVLAECESCFADLVHGGARLHR